MDRNERTLDALYRGRGTVSNIDWNKPVQTRDGGHVVIYTTTAKSFRYPVVGEWCNSNGDWMANNWTSRGQWTCERSEPHPNDLINVPQKPQQHTVWVNAVKLENDNIRYYAHGSRDEADEMATNLLDRIACFEHTFTFAEGEGLE